VTSRDGAALRDIFAVVQRRCPSVQVVLVPATVQGDFAPESLCFALDQIARWRKADVVIIGRGGGGREDLWAFNDERVARAVAACPIPTISAVGHEIDVSICDLVADLRAPTPSAAAEAAVPVAAELRERLRMIAASFSQLAADRVACARTDADDAAHRITASASRITERRHLALRSAAAKLNTLSPVATLQRGYAIVHAEDGRAIRSASNLAAGARVRLVMRDGTVRATVTDVVPNDSIAPREPGGTT
jgi:exodeoxyribonuclease VII large subunit